MTIGTRELATKIAALEAWQRSRAAQLAYSSIDAGAIKEFDLDGVQTGQYGRQYDGTSGASVLVSPPPPVPTNPVVKDGIFGATVKWDGMFVGGPTVTAPMDLKGVEVIAGPVGFDIASTPPFSTITSARGGEIFVPLEAGTFEVVLVTRTLAGRPSAPSGRVTVVSAPAVTDAELAQIEADVAAIPGQITAGMDEATANAVATSDIAIQQAKAASAVDAQTKASAAQQAAISAAATDATTKANNAKAAAEAAAALTAQQKADLAKAQALAGAATDAQTKANAAQQAAISAAATDAQTKANAAKQAAIDAAALTAQEKADLAQAAALNGSIPRTTGAVTNTYLATDAVTAVKIAANAIVAGKLAVDSVLAANIKAGEIKVGHLAAGSVVAGNIAADAVTASTIAANAIIAGKIAANAVVAGTIAANAVTATTIAANAVIAGKLAVDSVLAANIKAGEIQVGHLAAGSVIAGNIAANAVTAGTIAAGAIIAGKIAAGVVTATEIATDAITAVKVQAGAIIAGKLAANSVLASNITAYAIGVQHLAVGSTTNLAAGAAGEFLGSPGSIWDGIGAVTFSADAPPAGTAGYFVSSGTAQTPAAKLWDVEPNTEYLVETYVKASVAGSNLYVELRDQSGAHATVNTPASDGSAHGINGGTAYPVSLYTVPTTWTKLTAVAKTTATATKMRVAAIYFNHSSGTVTNATISIAIRVRERAAGRLVVDGSISANHLGALSVTAGKVAANAIIAGNIAADAVQANNIAAGQITAGKLAVGAVIAGNIAAGAVTATSLTADAIDGKVITGAIFQTSMSGARLRIAPNPFFVGPISGSADPHRIEFMDALPSSVGNTAHDPAYISARYSPAASAFGNYQMFISSGEVDNGRPAKIILQSGRPGDGTQQEVRFIADTVRVTGGFKLDGGTAGGNFAGNQTLGGPANASTGVWTKIWHSSGVYTALELGASYSQGNWTIKSAGLYSVTMSATWPNTTGSWRAVRIASSTNSTVYGQNVMPANAPFRTLSVTAQMYLTEGAVISGYAYQDSGATHSMPGHTNADPQMISIVRHVS